MLFISKLSLWISLLFTCRAHDPRISDKIISSVEYQESRSKYLVRDNGSCTGLMQVNYRYAHMPKMLLRIPVFNRVAGVRALNSWHKRSHGDLRLALASYNCGNAGLKGTCGQGYASAVMGRNIIYKDIHLKECMPITQLINYYLDNQDYLLGRRKFKWHYQFLPLNQQQQ